MKIIIVLPTYNERDNIIPLVTGISESLSTINHEIILLFVDDNSPDGTQDVINQLITDDRFNTKISLYARKNKEGLGRAYVAGFKKAIEMGADVIFEMDSDLSHDPRYLPIMIDTLISENVDVVIGSRRVAGGGTKNWGFHRKMVSWGANTFTHILLRLKIKDVTSGFRAFRCETTLKRLTLDDIKTNGYAFQLELIYAIERNLKVPVKEIPIIFIDRTKGKSKLGFSDIFEFFGEVIKLFFKGTKLGKKTER